MENVKGQMEDGSLWKNNLVMRKKNNPFAISHLTSYISLRKLLFLFSSFILVSCSGDSDEEEPIRPIEAEVYQFRSFEEKISYCIGLDHAFSAYTVYNAQDTKSKFEMTQIEAGMVDYLSGNELRIPFEARDSIFEFYLLEDGTVDETAIPKIDASYAVGMEEGLVLVSSLVGRGIDQVVDVEMLVKGVRDGIRNITPLLPLIDARTEVANYYSQLNLEDGELFLAENAKRDSVVTTESGLQYIIFKQGTGVKPNLTDTVMVHYTGRYIDGREFESTVPSGVPMQLSLLGVIPGWQEGIVLMKEGAQYRFFMPHKLAYGEKGSGPIEPFCALVFDIELLKVKRFQ